MGRTIPRRRLSDVQYPRIAVWPNSVASIHRSAPMIQRIADQPWIFITFVVVMILLWVGASMRVRRDRLRRHRAKVDRRNKARAERDRRWNPRP